MVEVKAVLLTITKVDEFEFKDIEMIADVSYFQDQPSILVISAPRFRNRSSMF